MSNAIAAMGTILKMGDGADPEVFTAIAEVRDISGPSLSGDTVDVTPHSTTSSWRRIIPTLLNPGEVTFDINFIPTEATHKDDAGGLLDLLKNQTRRNFQLAWSDAGATTWSFAGYVTKFEPSAGVEAELKASVTIAIDGAPTLV